MKHKIIQLISLKGLVVVLLLSLLPSRILAQNNMPPLHPKLQVLAKPQSTLHWFDFREEAKINPARIFTDLKDAFQLSGGDSMLLIKKENDKLGFNHYRYQQYYKNRRVVHGEYAVHQQPGGFVKSANGTIITGLNLEAEPSLKEQQALTNALQFMKAKKYLWQNNLLEMDLKRQQKNLNATYFPKGELVYAPAGFANTGKASDYRLAWSFIIYTDDPAVTAKKVYVDALTGQVIYYSDISMNCSGGTGTSAFNGTVTIHTELNGGFYRSHNDCQSTNIYVFNCNGGGAANNFYRDADNSWTDASQQSGVQGQWGAEMTYNYYNGQHSRQSWDGASGDLIAYNNAYAGSNNACWGCTGNQAIFYAGNTSSATDDWNTDDIMGHEFTHGVTQASANLEYQKESGALNESFSDIFGEMVESWAEGNCDYLVGADRGAIRSFINPKAYGQPDTYLGTNWANTTSCSPSGPNDNCGVHTNSGVQNHWFYLLAEGGSGTNDLGQSYTVTGITRFKARVIAYRALTMYLNSTSQYIDARKATLEAALDLYGQCSPEIIAVGDAWHAVGVESQSPAFAFNVCGTYPASGTLIQALSQLTASNGCTTEITPSSTSVIFTARDRVILYPGFKADAGSNFVAYLDPCSSTRWERTPTDPNIVMSDAEKGLSNNLTVSAKSPAATTEVAANSVSVVPNPFHSTFDVSISSKQDGKAQVTLYNSIGIKVQQKHNVAIIRGMNKVTLTGAALSNGVYMVEVIIGDVKTIHKIIKM